MRRLGDFILTCASLPPGGVGVALTSMDPTPSPAHGAVGWGHAQTHTPIWGGLSDLREGEIQPHLLEAPAGDR